MLKNLTLGIAAILSSQVALAQDKIVNVYNWSDYRRIILQQFKRNRH